MERVLRTPLDEDAVRALRVGDAVMLDGVVWGIRDATLMRIFDQGQPPPADLRGGALLHVAPNVRRSSAVPSGYVPTTVGTTTSMRMDRFTEGLLRDYGVRAIIGKGGLSDASSAALARYGGVYLAIVGGAASVETEQVEAIEHVYWEDLMPECLWQFRVRAFGPLTVAMDAAGASMYRDVAARARQRLADVYAKLGLSDES
ncbi:MAG TPA: fumarate hydratase C-terminal domain-containing protein [bacterium]|nr:fumarate hydratase C-terminal domain-containing protein [bacterium]